VIIITKRTRTITRYLSASQQMSNSRPTDTVARLRSGLKHFEENGDFCENLTVSEIKAHLLRRIAELDSAMHRTKELECWAFPVNANAAPGQLPQQPQIQPLSPLMHPKRERTSTQDGRHDDR
jgi:hypothetical protein